MNIQTRKYKQQMENYQLQTLEDLVNSRDDWTNIQDIIQLTIKKQSEIMNSQQRAIKELERQMEQKMDRSEMDKNMLGRQKNKELLREMNELQSRVDCKVDQQDLQKVLNRFVEQKELDRQLESKVGLDEMRGLIDSRVNHNQMKGELVAIQNKVQKISEQWSRSGLVEQQQMILKSQREMQSQLMDKVDREVMEHELSLKANKQSVMTALKRKINKEDCYQIIKQKADNKDIIGLELQIQRKVGIEDIEQQIHQIYQEMKIIGQNSQQKENQMLGQIKQEAQKMENVRDGLIKGMEQYQLGVEKELQKHRQGISEVSVMVGQMQQKNVKKEQLEEIRQWLDKKVDLEMYEEMLRSQRQEIWREMENTQRSLKQWKREGEVKQDEVMKYVEGWVSKIGDQHIEWDQEMGLIQKRQSDYIQEVNDQINSLRMAFQQQNKKEMELLNTKIQKLNEQSNSRVNMSQYKNDKYGLEQQINQKVDLNEIQNAFDKQQQEYQIGLDCLKEEIKRMIQDSMQDYNDMYESKADKLMVEQQYVSQKQIEEVLVQIENKVEVVEYEEMQRNIDLLCQNMKDRVKVVAFEESIDAVTDKIQQLHREINRKKDDGGVSQIEQQVIDFNRELDDVKQNIANMVGREQFDEFINDQTLINESLCTENIIGRWTWKNGTQYIILCGILYITIGQLNNGMIPWEVQVVNTLPDNFIWEKDKTVITVGAPGLYEVNFGFYQRNKAEVDLIVNNESILLLGDGDQKTVQHSQGNLVGITYKDYLVLPARARISIGYKGEYGGEGFVGLKRL